MGCVKCTHLIKITMKNCNNNRFHSILKISNFLYFEYLFKFKIVTIESKQYLQT